MNEWKREVMLGKRASITKLIGNMLIVEPEMPMEQQSVRSVTLPTFPADSGFTPTLDPACNCVDVWHRTGTGNTLKAYLRINEDNTCTLMRGTDTGYPHKEKFPSYEEARLYLEAVLLLDIQPD